MEMRGILDAINKVLGFNPNSPSYLAERKAQEGYSRAIDKAKRDYGYTMTQALHDYHKAREVKGYGDASAIGKVYSNTESQATRGYIKAEEQASKDYRKASKSFSPYHYPYQVPSLTL